MKKMYHRKQQGFSFLSVVLVIVAVVAVIGIWGFSGQGTLNSSNNGKINPSIQGSSVINDGATIKTEFDRLIINGSSASSIVFKPNIASTSTAPNILDPINGIQVPKHNKNIIRSNAATPEGIWVYNSNMIMVAGIKDTVCKSINKSLYGSESIPAVSSVTNGAEFVTGATDSLPTTTRMLDLSTVPAAAGWVSGCVSANGTPDNNLYFRVLKSGLCGSAPTSTQTASCPAGYTGSWTQTRTYTSAPAPTCWTPSGWTPTTAPAGACTASCPPVWTDLGNEYCEGNDLIRVYADGSCGEIHDNTGYSAYCDPNACPPEYSVYYRQYCVGKEYYVVYSDGNCGELIYPYGPDTGNCG